jgi:hypothetical protein
MDGTAPPHSQNESGTTAIRQRTSLIGEMLSVKGDDDRKTCELVTERVGDTSSQWSHTESDTIQHTRSWSR